MRKLFIALFCLLSLNSFASISKQQTQQIFDRLISANHISATLQFDDSDEDINAYGEIGHVLVTKGMLNYADASVMVYVLSHELGHATGHIPELEADIVSGRIGAVAGYNVCPGAKKFLLTIGLEGGDGIHPRGDVRYAAMCHEN